MSAESPKKTSRPTWVERSRRVASYWHLGPLEIRILAGIEFQPEPDRVNPRFYAFLSRIATTVGCEDRFGRGAGRLLTWKLGKSEGRRSRQGYGWSVVASALRALSFTNCFMSISVIFDAVGMIAMHSRHSRYDRVKEKEEGTCVPHVTTSLFDLAPPCPRPRRLNHRLSPR
jgi:hypothetical protein